MPGHPSIFYSMDNDQQRFDPLGGDYAKDNFKVYYRGRELKDASVLSFEYLGGGYAKDNWRRYYKGRATKH